MCEFLKHHEHNIGDVTRYFMCATIFLFMNTTFKRIKEAGYCVNVTGKLPVQEQYTIPLGPATKFFFSILEKQTGAGSSCFIIVLSSCQVNIFIQAISIDIIYLHQTETNSPLPSSKHNRKADSCLSNPHISHIVTGARMNTESRNHFHARLQNIFFYIIFFAINLPEKLRHSIGILCLYSELNGFSVLISGQAQQCCPCACCKLYVFLLMP